MSDSYPESFTIEIEREKLCRYLRYEALIGPLLPCLFFGTYFGAIGGVDRMDGPFNMWTELLRGMAIGFLVGLAIGLFLYLLLGHFLSRVRANRLEVSVAGPYLRIIEGVLIRSDRKLHFRSIVDYSCFSGPLMRFCGVEGILLNTTASGRSSMIRLKGIKNALEVRDMLSEIDRQRENS